MGEVDIGIPRKSRKQIADGLSRLLADTYTLYLKTHNFHLGWKDMVQQLVEGQEAVVRTARALFPIVDAARDEPTADLLTQRMQAHEKGAWMLRSLLD